MITFITTSILGISLLQLIISDIRYRRISVGTLILFFVSTLIWRLLSEDIPAIALNMALNGLLLLLMFSGAYLLLCIYKRRWIRLKHYIGSGDIYFLLATTPLFYMESFLLFLIAALCISLLWYYALLLFSSKNRSTIPLVSTTGITLTIYLLINTMPYGV